MVVVDGFELKPCPCCGRDAADFGTLQEEEDCAFFEDEDRCPAFDEGVCTGIHIVCNVNKGGCGMSTGYAWSKADAVRRWNMRADEGDDRK